MTPTIRPRPSIDRMLASCIKESTRFVDVGALWGTENETVSKAKMLGAESVSIIDIQIPGHELWLKMQNRLSQLEVSCNFISGDIRDIFKDYQQSFDVVFCSGIIYHDPSPIEFLQKLTSMSSNFLILGSMVVPEKIKNRKGSLDLTNVGAAFIPFMSNKSKEAVMAQYASQGVPEISSLNQDFKFSGIDDTTPWYWLMTRRYLDLIMTMCNFQIIDTGSDWGENDHFILAKRII